MLPMSVMMLPISSTRCSRTQRIIHLRQLFSDSTLCALDWYLARQTRTTDHVSKAAFWHGCDSTMMAEGLVCWKTVAILRLIE